MAEESKTLYYWYENKSTVILWLILFFPVGLYGLWKSSRFSKNTRWIITGFFIVFLLISSQGQQEREKRIAQTQNALTPQTPVEQGAGQPQVPAPQAVAQVTEESSIEWSEVNQIYNIKYEKTDLQKREAWKRFKGKKVIWFGTVSEISDGFTGLTLQVKMNRDTFISDVLVRLNKSARNKAAQLKQGEPVRFSGRLDDWGTLLPITLTDGEIL